MNRREAIRFLGMTAVPSGLIAGCVGDNDNPGDGSVSPDEPEEWTDAPDVESLATEAGEGIDLEATVHNHGTYDRPPVLSVTMTSEFDQAHAFGPFAGGIGPLNRKRLSRASGSHHVRLIGDAIVESGDCWIPESGPPDEEFVELEPDGSTNGSLAIVLDDPPEENEGSDRSGCYRIGTYSATTTVDVLEAGADPTAEDRSEQRVASVDLGLEVELV